MMALVLRLSREQREQLMRHGNGDDKECRYKWQGGDGHGRRASLLHPVGAADIAIVLEWEHGVQAYVDVVQVVGSLPLRFRVKDTCAGGICTIWTGSLDHGNVTTSPQLSMSALELGLSRGTRGSCFGEGAKAPHAVPPSRRPHRTLL